MTLTKDELAILYNCLNSQIHVNPRPEEQPKAELLKRIKAELQSKKVP